MSSTIKQAILSLKSRIEDAYTAIAAKGGTLPATQDSANLPTAIASIPSGSAEDPEEKDVLLLDYDGTILYSYTWEEFEEVTALPSASDLPTHEGLTFVRWTNTLDELKKSSPLYTGTGKHQNKITMSGAMYETADNFIHVIIRLYKDGQTFVLNSSVRNRTIDWGDGTIESGLGTVASHTYIKAGRYDIIDKTSLFYISIADKTSKQAVVEILDSGYSSTTYGLLYQNGLLNCVNLVAISCPPNMELCTGNDDIGGTWALRALVTNNIGGVHRTLNGSGIIYCTSWVNSGVSSGENVYRLRRVNFPDNYLNLHTNNYSLQYIWMDANKDVGSMRYCYALRELHLPYASVPSLANTNYFENVPNTCKIFVKNGLLSSYEAATNWSTIYAQYTFIEED